MKALIALALLSSMHVVDGDTVDIDQIRYRLAGIDTPEGAQRCLNAEQVRYACGTEATKQLKELLTTLSYTVRVTDTDRYGRQVAWFDLPQGGSINCMLVRKGFAWAYRKYSGECIDEEEAARTERLGVFATENQEPWNYRHKKH